MSAEELIERLENDYEPHDALRYAIESLREQRAEIKRLRRALDNIKVRAYELGQIELHDQALRALRGD